MNAVNLLPTKHRPRTPTGGQQGSAYAVIGVLGVALVMVLLYVLTANGINSKKDGVTRAQAETAQAEKRVAELSSYGNFNQVKEQRVSSVKQLASGRIDWERLARGLAHVLPKDVWLIKATASATGKGDNGSGGAAPAPSTAPPAQGTPPAGGGSAQATPASGAGEPAAGDPPVLVLNGCARDRHDVAVTLVRLRELSGAEDVQLVSVQKPESSGATGGGDTCGKTGKVVNYTWVVNVVFKPNPGSAPSDGKVPARLGGGQ